MTRVSMSPPDLVAYAHRWLDANPNAPLMDRAAFATVIAHEGQVTDDKATFGEVAHILGVPAHEILQGLLALREQSQLSSRP